MEEERKRQVEEEKRRREEEKRRQLEIEKQQEIKRQQEIQVRWNQVNSDRSIVGGWSVTVKRMNILLYAKRTQKVSGYDQELPQPYTADQPKAP